MRVRHVYCIDGEPTLGSVTGLIHAFSDDFDAHKVIAKMSTSRTWPRPGYLKSSVACSVLDDISQLDGGAELVRRWQADPRDERSVCDAAQDVSSVSPHASALVNCLAMEPAEIIAVWDANRDKAAMEGTWMHWHFEV